MHIREESIGRIVSILYRIEQSRMGKQLEAYNIGAGQFSFLAELLIHDGISQDEVAANFRCDKATAARAIQHLEKHGYLERKQSEDDGRVKKVFVTDKAREFSPILFSILKNWTETLLEGFSAKEKDTLFQLLNLSLENATKDKFGKGDKS
jgi:DNA-binding MarR family transcriptional regulator